MEGFEVYDIVGLQAMVLAGTEATKRVGQIEDTRWSPLIAICWGIVLTVLWGLTRAISYTNASDIATAILMGIFFVGLGSIGLYSGARNTLRVLTKPESPTNIM